MSADSFDKVVQQEGQLSMLQLYAIHEDDSMPDFQVHPVTQPNNQKPDIQCLLQQFPEVFADHEGLPPFRSGFDHQIPLKEGSNPVNLRPYRYPLLQKDVIE